MSAFFTSGWFLLVIFILVMILAFVMKTEVATKTIYALLAAFLAVNITQTLTGANYQLS